jgi:hypothetical protein
MKVTDFKNTRFLTKEDVDEETLATIHMVCEENVANDNEPKRMRPAIYFNEFDRPLICNFTNAQALGRITGHLENVEKNWIGKKVVLYVDPNVMMKGKVVGGIRIKAAPNGESQDVF